MKIKLQHVHYIPKQLSPCVLYVSKEFDTAAHLCACGCGSKIRTPLGPTEWLFMETKRGPSLYPSVGNWQQTCKSHYWIQRGEMIWSDSWTQEQISDGRCFEEERRRAYFDTETKQSNQASHNIWSWLNKLFVRK